MSVKKCVTQSCYTILFHRETRQEFLPQSLEIIEEGPLRVQIKIAVPLAEHGDMTLFVTLEAESPCLAFRCEVSVAELGSESYSARL